MLALLEALRGIGHAVPETTLAPLLAAPVPALVLAAVDLTSTATALRTAAQAHAADPRVAGALAVRLRKAIGPDAELDAAIRSALSGTGALPTLQALCRNPLPEHAEAVGDVVKRAKTAEVRVAALQALACLEAGPGRLYAALKAPEEPVRLAAIAGLARARAPKRAVSFRLADVAFRDKGATRTAALAALARLADPQFAKNVLALAARLSPRERLDVVPALAGYGEAAVPTLSKVASGAAPELVAAVRTALQAIGTASARAALQGLPAAPASAPAAVDLLAVLRAACALHDK